MASPAQKLSFVIFPWWAALGVLIVWPAIAAREYVRNRRLK